MGARNPGLCVICNPAVRIAILLFVHLMLNCNSAFSQDDLNVIRGKWLVYNDAQDFLYSHLAKQAFDLLKKRSDEVSAISTREGWRDRQSFIRKELNDIIGPFPEKTPLNARIIRVIDKKDYRIEHIVFESQPGFYVTSSLFLPSGIKKGTRAPAILYCSGHSEEGYRSAVYMHVILNLVSKGFIVFAFDPVGQGERLEYFDPQTGKSKAGGPTNEHSYPGAQAFIAGSSQAYYMIWDGIRAVDYLISRKEVDPSRIGITGRSGGGTQSACIAAYDDRIYAVAPENYITNFTRLLQTVGPQDAEQNLFNLIARGLDHPDFLIVRAPKPTLVITTSSDMFSIQGAMETEKEVSEIYRMYEKSGNFKRIEDDAGHSSTRKNREAMYAFFMHHLANPGDPSDKDFTMPSPDEMKVTPKGQISESCNSLTVFLLNRERYERENEKLKPRRAMPDEFTMTAVNSAERLSGYIGPSDVEDPVFTGRIVRNGYVVEKYFVRGEGNYVIPYLLFKPDNEGKRYMIYLHPSGKSKEASQGGEIERFMKNGFTVIAPDLPGTGELQPDNFRGDAYFDGVSHNIWYASILIGRSIAGVQAGDVARFILLVKKRNKDAAITGFARGALAPVLLHAAAFTKSFSSIILMEPLCSYRSIVMNRFYNHGYIPSAVPGALKSYDLPDLAASLAPVRLILAGIKDGSAKTEDEAGIIEATEIIRTSYDLKNAADQLTILPEKSDEEVYKLSAGFN
ncbi:MAG TPA: acetylxylan esterase [Bacteroidales bacterium]|jgi:cephalosporin-C deacetylase-like acetyl esterase|nr:acetylxylan esterase [Bacteroidales bacterium]